VTMNQSRFKRSVCQSPQLCGRGKWRQRRRTGVVGTRVRGGGDGAGNTAAQLLPCSCNVPLLNHALVATVFDNQNIRQHHGRFFTLCARKRIALHPTAEARGQWIGADPHHAHYPVLAGLFYTLTRRRGTA
jgi:hypothetical protein